MKRVLFLIGTLSGVLPIEVHPGQIGATGLDPSAVPAVPSVGVESNAPPADSQGTLSVPPGATNTQPAGPAEGGAPGTIVTPLPGAPETAGGGYLGATLQTLKGVYVRGVQPGGPAAVVGLKAGDIILAVNGRPVQDARQFAQTVLATAPGAQLTLSLLRGANRRQTLRVVVGIQPARGGTPAPPPIATVPPSTTTAPMPTPTAPPPPTVTTTTPTPDSNASPPTVVLTPSQPQSGTLSPRQLTLPAQTNYPGPVPTPTGR